MAEFTLPLDISTLEIVSQHYDAKGNIIFEVVSTCTETPCHKCGKPATKRYGHASPLDIRHTSILDRPVYLRIKPVRYQCEQCDDDPTTSEKYSWCSKGGKITKGLEEYLMRSVINSTIKDVSRKVGISYRTVSSVINNRVGTKVDWSLYIDLNTIGIDEISDRKGHQDFVAIISAKDKFGTLSVLAVLDDRKKE